MKAITTKYLGATNFRGSRIKAVAADGDKNPPQVTLAYDHGLNIDENHKKAAIALAWKLDWQGEWVGGSVEHGYCFVNASRTDFKFNLGGGK